MPTHLTVGWEADGGAVRLPWGRFDRGVPKMKAEAGAQLRGREGIRIMRTG